MTNSQRIVVVFISGILITYPGRTQLLSLVNAVSTESVKESTVEQKLPDFPEAPVTIPNLTAEGVYIADLHTFTPVFQKSAQQRFYPASTTKMITALVTKDLYALDYVVQVKKVKAEGQVMGLVENEKMSIENLLYGLLVYSGNDVAYALADEKGYDEFIALMNSKANDLGMKNTRFLNPAGLDQPGHYSTPFDLALAGRAVLKDSQLRHMVSVKEITISDEDFKIFHKLSNINELLGEVKGIGGLKTGYTELAGQNLISYYKRADGREFLVVILKSSDRFADTREVVRWLQTIKFVTPQ